MKQGVISAVLTLMILCSACGQDTSKEEVAIPTIEELEAAQIENAMESYSSIIYGDGTFHNLDSGEVETLKKFGEGISPTATMEVASAAYVDLDGKNGKELILYFLDGAGVYLIFSTIDGEAYCTMMTYRCFEMLQADGKYLGSGGAGDSYFHRLSIDKTGVTEETFAEYHDGVLTVGGEVVEGYDEWFEENYSNPAFFLKIQH